MKSWCYLFVVLTLLLSVGIVLAQENSTLDDDSSDSEKLDAGFACLEQKAGDCADLTTRDVALTILATPDNIFDTCVDELESRAQGDNFGNVRDTALAILALQHAGEETETYEDWLITQEKIPTDLIWYLEQDSNEATQCHIGYDSQDYIITINENKKIDSDAGPCLEKTESSFWLEVSPECYNKEFIVECDKDFITTLLYKNENSPTIYVMDNTESSPAYGTISTSVTSKCFGGSSTCDYEASAWATLALLKTGNAIDDYIPYLVALSDSYEEFLPDAFLFMLTNHDTYATQLFEDQQLGNFWVAPNTAYDKFYDTALALLSLSGSSSEKITDAENWLFFSQSKTNGCWQNSVTDTAMVLWALAGKTGKTSGGGGVSQCGTSGYYCIETSDCPIQEQLSNFFCSSLSTICCETENLKTCNEYGGEVCSSGEVCIGNEKNSLDSPACCTGTCQVPQQQTDCEANFYECQNSCTDSQESTSLSCGTTGLVCCKTKTTQETSSNLWIWILIILILLIAGAILWIKRAAVKLWWFKTRSKFGKGKSGGTPRGNSAPPRPPRGPPGRPPTQRPPLMRRSPQNYARNQRARPQDKELDATFAKLKKMSG